MPLQLHDIEIMDGSSALSNQDRLRCGIQSGLVNNSSAGPIASVTVSAPGSLYTSIPTLTLSGNGSGATLVARMKALTAAIVTAGSGYAPTNTITLTGGTFSTAAILTVTNTKLVSVAVNAGGSGYQVGDTITLAGGTASTQAVLTVATLSTDAVATVTISTAGVYTANSTSFTQASTSGSGTGATFNTGLFGVNAFTISTAGAYSVLPSNPVAQGSTNGSGTGATVNINSWGVATITVSAGGTNYDNTSALAITGGAGSGATATLALTNVGNAVTIPVVFSNLPNSYAVEVTPSQACFQAVTSKTNSGFNVVLTPKDASTAITAGTFDVMVWG